MNISAVKPNECNAINSPLVASARVKQINYLNRTLIDFFCVVARRPLQFISQQCAINGPRIESISRGTLIEWMKYNLQFFILRILDS